MSFSEDLSRIVCDGEACTRIARAPVALHPSLLSPQEEETIGASSAKSWLFVSDEERRQRHYCPGCAPQFLKRLLPGKYAENDKATVYRGDDL